jgi:hypothetical protein
MLPQGEGLDFLSPSDRTCWKEVLHSLGASSGLSDGDLDDCTSCDGDGVTFSFHACLVCGLNIGGISSSFTGSSGSLSSSSSHSFHQGWFLWRWND